MSFFLTLSVFISAINLLLGFFIYSKDRKSLIHQFFFLIILSIEVWIIGLIFIPLIPIENKDLAIFVGRIPFFGSSLFGGFFFYFSQLFPRKTIYFSKRINTFLFCFIFILSVVSLFTNLILEDISPGQEGPQPEFGFLYPFWGFVFLSFMIGGIIILAWKYKTYKGVEKTQIQYFFIGVALTTIFGATTNLIAPAFFESYSLWQLGPASLVFLVVFTTYAITKHHLFNIKVIATELLVALVAAVLLIDLILSDSLSAILLKLGIFLAFVYLGVSLIRSVLKEIERRKQLEELSNRLKKANIRLKELDKVKSEFLSIASHQLRTPLSVIKGFISMILEGSYGKLSRKVKDPMRETYRSNERLIRLVNDLLNVSRIEAGAMKLNFEIISLEDIISNVIQEMEFEAKKKKLSLKLEKPKRSLPKILIDRDKTRQVILNVIDNAIKYTKKGGVTIKLQVVDEKLLTTIADTGEGMTKQEISRIFESFTRGRAGTKTWTEGAGLGLYVAKKFIEMHKGKIWAESKGKDRGSTFYIELPIK